MRWRSGWAAASSALLLASGCGSDARHAAPRPPRIPQAVAAPLAARADAVAAALDRADACGARGRTYALQREAERAPLSAAYRGRLLKAVARLTAALPDCSPSAPPPAPPSSPPAAEDGKDDLKHGRKDKHKSHGDGKKKEHDD
jgi:hypothetical protein